MSGDMLFLAHRLPYPPDRGDRIRSWHMLRHLARTRRVHLVAPVDTAADARWAGTLQEVAVSVTTAPRNPSPRRAMRRALARGTPASVEAFVVPRLERAVRDLIATGTIDTIFAYSGQAAHYVPRNLGKQRFIMDFVDMDSAKFAQQGTQYSGLVGAAHRFEARRLLAWEVSVARRADAVLFVSEAEAELFRSRTQGHVDGGKIHGIANGIDSAHFAPDAVPRQPDMGDALIVFTGQMDYAPNVEAVTRFANRIFPRLLEQNPNARFAIVGRDPLPEVCALARAPGVIVTGTVDDPRPWLAAAAVVVAPLLLARGIQNKVLEAMAMARATVVSPGAAIGITAIDGVEWRIADNDDAQFAAVDTLLKDPVARAMMGVAARVRVMKDYDWEMRLAALDALLTAPVAPISELTHA